MTPYLLLFDIDGTLLRCGGCGMRAMRTVANQLYGAHFRWDGIEPGGHLDPLIYAEAAALNDLPHSDAEHERFRGAYLDELARELERNRAGVRVLPGVRALLDQLHHRAQTVGDVALGLVTGNYTRAAALKLATIGVEWDWFRITACGDEGPDRPALVQLALQRFANRSGHPADPARTLVIGDTERDVHCAHAHHCRAFAVATGWVSAAALRQAGADYVVDDLADPTPLLRLLG